MNAVNDGLDFLFEHSIGGWVCNHESSLCVLKYVMKGVRAGKREKEENREGKREEEREGARE